MKFICLRHVWIMAPAGSFHACLAANKLVNVFSAVLDVCVMVGKRRVQVLV